MAIQDSFRQGRPETATAGIGEDASRCMIIQLDE
jgi:hypothetical protein